MPSGVGTGGWDPPDTSEKGLALPPSSCAATLCHGGALLGFGGLRGPDLKKCQSIERVRNDDRAPHRSRQWLWPSSPRVAAEALPARTLPSTRGAAVPRSARSTKRPIWPSHQGRQRTGLLGAPARARRAGSPLVRSLGPAGAVWMPPRGQRPAKARCFAGR
jgi:hypothetical protein